MPASDSFAVPEDESPSLLSSSDLLLSLSVSGVGDESDYDFNQLIDSETKEPGMNSNNEDMDQTDTQTATTSGSNAAMEEMDNSALNDDELANSDDGAGGSSEPDQDNGSFEG